MSWSKNMHVFAIVQAHVSTLLADVAAGMNYLHLRNC
jgi:hypothetical protein